MQGKCTIAMALNELIDSQLGGDPTRVKAHGCKLTGMVFGGDELAVQLLERNDEKLVYRVNNLTTGKTALSDGIILI